MSGLYSVSMTVPERPIPAERQVILAHLTVGCGPLHIVGAALAKLDGGEMRVWLPSFGRERRIVVHEREERGRLLQAALNSYCALTGRDPAETPLAKASPDQGASA